MPVARRPSCPAIPRGRISDRARTRRRQTTPPGFPFASTVAGSGKAGAKNGTGRSAEFNKPQGVAVAPDGRLFVADRGNNAIRSISRSSAGRRSTSAPLPTAIPKFPPMRTPHIYLTNELKRLLTATEMLDAPRAPLRALAYRTLLLRLSIARIRLNESLTLTLNDVYFTYRLIPVRNS